MTDISRRWAAASVLATLAMVGFALPPAHAQAPQAVTGAQTIDADGVIALISKTPNLVIIDARHPKDFADGHIENARRLLDEDMLTGGPDAFAKLAADKSTPLLFYCNGPACGRAAKSAAAAVGWGYTKVSYYYAGIPDWRAKNLPLDK